MDAIKVKNLRSLVEPEKIELAKITVFVGKNSSGKSTMLRCFPLLKQTFEVKTSEPLLWYGNYVDFGSFRESLCSNSSEKSIEFEFTYNINPECIRDRIVYRYVKYRNISFTNLEAQKLIFTVVIEENKVVNTKIDLNDQHVTINYDDYKLSINGRDYSQYISGFIDFEGIIPEIIFKEEINTNKKGIYADGFFFNRADDMFFDKLTSKLHSISNKRCKKDTLTALMSKLTKLGSKRDIYNNILSINDLPKSINKYIRDLDFSSDCFSEINDLIIIANFNGIISFCNDLLKNDALSVTYSKPLRADVQRYYRIQGLNVDEVDASGQNIPMFLNSLVGGERKMFENFTQKLFGFSFDIKSSEGHVSMMLKTANAKESVNIADVGVGYSQILPILANLWRLSNRYSGGVFHQMSYQCNYFVIEQPELHLHPAMQGLLVDAFIDTINNMNSIKANDIGSKKDIKILLETHSETMISRLGYLIAKGKLSKNDVNIYIFDKNTDGKTTIKKTGFNDSGKLQEWPVGFFSWETI